MLAPESMDRNWCISEFMFLSFVLQIMIFETKYEGGS